MKTIEEWQSELSPVKDGTIFNGVKEESEFAEDLNILRETPGVTRIDLRPDDPAVAEAMSLESQGSQAKELHMEPILNLKEKGVSRPLIAFLVLALLGAIGLGFLFTREYSAHQQTARELETVRSANASLEASLSELKTDLNQQREEVSRLARELESAHALAGTLKSEHGAELGRLKNLYESQLVSLQSTLKTRDDLIGKLESDLKSLRRRIEQGEPLPEGAAPLQILSGTAAHTKLAADSDAPVVPKNLPVKKGMVVQVNQTHHFIITDLNRTQGVELGQTVQIYQEGEPLGAGRVERVYETLSAVTILSEDTLERVKTGDAVYLAAA